MTTPTVFDEIFWYAFSLPFNFVSDMHFIVYGLSLKENRMSCYLIRMLFSNSRNTYTYKSW